MVYRNRWLGNLLLCIFVQVFQNLYCTIFCFAIDLANKAMAERIDQNAPFGSLSRNTRYLEKIL